MSESAVRAYAAEKRFGAATLERWLAQPPADRDALLELAARLRLGENQLRDVMNDLVAIGSRRECGIAAVLQGAELRAVHDRRLGRNDALRALKQDLRRMRYPQLSGAERRLAALGRRLQLPAGARVELPENLEGEHIAITLRARSATELRAQAQAVAAALQGDAVDEMFALLEGHW
jgi:hypothetical protein